MIKGVESMSWEERRTTGPGTRRLQGQDVRAGKLMSYRRAEGQRPRSQGPTPEGTSWNGRRCSAGLQADLGTTSGPSEVRLPFRTTDPREPVRAAVLHTLGDGTTCHVAVMESPETWARSGGEQAAR